MIFLRPYEDEPLPSPDELYEAAKLLSDRDFSWALIRAINGEANVRREFRTFKGRCFLRAFLAWVDFETWLHHDGPEPFCRISLWRVTNALQGVRRVLRERGW